MKLKQETKEIIIECPSCKGTGLYKGIAERNQCAVICHTCDGKGFTSYKYREFNGRKHKPNVTRIFQNSCGYVHSAVNQKGIKFEEGGCTYSEWLSGARPKPVKDLYCPYIWDNKGYGNEPCSRCKEGCGFGVISNCRYFADKAACWKEYEANGVEQSCQSDT